MTSLLSRFRGCLAAATVGDSLGIPYEHPYLVDVVPLATIQEKNKSFMENSTFLRYSDDTAMMRCVSRCLLANDGKIDGADLARRFAIEFNAAPERGYGGNAKKTLGTLFNMSDEEMRLNWKVPASLVFDGKGSNGNGTCMRVAPVALAAIAKNKSDPKQALAHAREFGLLQCLPTHTEKDGMTTCECYTALLTNIGTRVVTGSDPKKEIGSLIEIANERGCAVLVGKLNKMIEFLSDDSGFNGDPVVITEVLGHGVGAIESAPAAMFAFFWGVKNNLGLMGSIEYAITIGGDTDTIACMCGALVGMKYGIEEVPAHWIALCEGAKEMDELATQLHDQLN